jgi:glycolate oxidase FAD binding subunit
MDKILQQFREQILNAGTQQQGLVLRGGGTKLWYGNPASDTDAVLDTQAYRGIISYEPTELVISARCGTSLKEIEALLDQQGQMLAFEPPHFGPTATVGGMLATGLSGPRRVSVGAVRDFVLGVSIMNGTGEVLRFGGQVMKNVAGYDVSRLMAGSLGSLGLLLDVSLKVLPKPVAETSLMFAMSEVDALSQLNRWAGQALPISASSYYAGRLMLRLSGSTPALRAAKQKLGGQEIDSADDYWKSLREQSHHFFTPEEDYALWRVSLPSTAQALKLRSKSLIEWGGAQRWLWTNETEATLRSTIQAAGGHVTRFRYGAGDSPAFTELAAPILKIHRQLKVAFDPAAIFNRGRLFE